MVNSQARKLLFFSISSKKELKASSRKDFEWSTWTCPFGFPVHVNSVDRSRDGFSLVTGDNFGKVKLFKYPYVNELSRI